VTKQETAARMQIATYALFGVGILALIVAHEWGAADASNTTGPAILAAAGTLCFVVAGLLARKLMKGGGAN
jgi:hypothetical protein